MVTTRSHLLVALTTVVVGIGFMSPAFAHGKPAPAPNRVDKRQDNQRARIQHGKATGEITRGEAKRIEREQRSIKRTEKRAKADGVVTKREARKIERKQNKSSRHIKNAKHNNKKQPRARR